MIRLRSYQQKMVDGLRASYNQGKRSPLLVLPTGGGKTFIFCYVAEKSKQKGNNILILVHRDELLRQASASLLKLDVYHGLISPQYTPNYGEQVQVASVQTYVSRMDKISWKPDLIVPDEAHHGVAGTWARIFGFHPDARILGVTATPVRTDGRGLGDIFDDMIIGPTMRWLMDEGYLTDYKAYAPKIQADLSSITLNAAGDYNDRALAAAMDKPVITGDAVQHYKRICPGVPAVAFCSSIEHAKHVAESFREAGFDFRSLDGKMKPSDRAELIKMLGDGTIHGLTSCDIISEGTDIPVVTCAILLRPTQSEGLFLQQVGRALRPVYNKHCKLNTQEERLHAIATSEKKEAIILDCVGNLMRHGLPDDDRGWQLDQTQRRITEASATPDEDKMKQCPECYAAHRPCPKCPNCGFVYVILSAGPPEQIDGDLHAVDPDAMRKARAKIESMMENKYRHLLKLEKERGYKEGWAKHVVEGSRAKHYKEAGII